MDRRIKFRHLEAFVSIARAKSLKRAAEQLNLTQPAISKTLKDLEDIVGATLMERGRAGVAMTPEGDVFLQFATQCLSALQNGLTSLASLSEGAPATLSIGALPSVAAALLPEAVQQFQPAAPNTVVQLHEGPHDHLMEQLRAGQLDLVIGRLGRPETMAGLSFTQLYSERVVVVAAPDHPLAQATQLEQLTGYPIIYPPQNSAIRPLVARQMIATGLPLFAQRIESASGEFGRAMTLGKARAIWFISQGVVAADVAAGRLKLLAIDMPATVGPVGIMARSEEAPTPIAHIFRQSLLAAAAKQQSRAKEKGLVIAH